MADRGNSPGSRPNASRGPWAGTAPRLRGRVKTERNRRILRRHGGICHVCGQPGATEVDHVVLLARGGADDESNLRPIHAEPCHAEKTKRDRQRPPRRRPPERHPGIIEP